MPGYLVPDKGLIKIYAPMSGIIHRRNVAAGKKVHQGDALFVISTRRSSLEAIDVNSSLIADAKKTRQTLLDQIQKVSQLKIAQINATKMRRRGLKDEIVAIHKQTNTEIHRLKIAESNLDRLRTLLKLHLIAPLDYQKQYEKVLSQKSAVQELRKEALSVQHQIDRLPSEIAIEKLKAANQIAEYRKDIAQVDQQLTQYKAGQNFVIHAPSDGTVAGVIAEVGQQVKPNRPLMTLLPKGAILTARLLVPTSAIGFIHRGETVRLRYDAFPYQRFGLYGGHITQISKAIFAPADIPAPVSLQQPVYLVTVTLDSQSVRAYGKTTSLQAGMSLSADIIIERESLIHWILDPLYSIRGRI